MQSPTFTQTTPPSGPRRSFGQRSTPSSPATLRFAVLLAAMLVTFAGLRAQSNYATPYTFTTLAGTDSIGSSQSVSPGYGWADGVGSAARFNDPFSTAVDSQGNVYVADSLNHTIRRITPTGVVSTLAGLAGTSGSADGTGSAARFNEPRGVAVDRSGNVYVADTSNFTIRKITIDTNGAGTVTTLAGTAGAYGTANGTGSAARFGQVSGLAVGSSGDVYVADSASNLIRKITAVGEVTTLAGGGGMNSTGAADGIGSDARFNWPVSLALDPSDSVLYVGDLFNHTVRTITIDAGGIGTVSTLVGSPGTSGTTDGTGSAARFNGPWGLALDGAGNLYVVDSYNHTIRKITIDAGGVGTVTTWAGAAGSFGSSHGAGSAARFFYPRGLAADSTGTLYVPDSLNHSIRKITPAGVVAYFAGRPGYGPEDGTGSDARFYSPTGLALGSSGDVYVADRDNHTIRKVTSDGVVTTLAGAAGSRGTADGEGNVARFNRPSGVALHHSGEMYVADRGNHTIRKVTLDGVVATFAGSAGDPGASDGTVDVARFSEPNGVAVDEAGNVYVADRGNHTIRKITAEGIVTTLAGLAGASGSADGTGSAARFSTPAGVAADSLGNVYVADMNNHTIRKITAEGVVTTWAGMAGSNGSRDGARSSALFTNPYGVAVDSAGDVYVAEYGNHMIRKIASNGDVTTLAGSPSSYETANGSGSAAHLLFPTGVALDSSGHLYVAEFGGHVIRKGARQHSYA